MTSRHGWHQRSETGFHLQSHLQVLGKQSCAANEQGRTGIWKALRRGWNSNRVSGTRSGQPPTEILSDPRQVSPLVRKTRVEDPPRSPVRTLVEYGRPDSVQHGYCSSPGKEAVFHLRKKHSLCVNRCSRSCSNILPVDSHRKPTRAEEPPICCPLTTSPRYKVPDPSRGASGAPSATQPYRRHSLQPQHIQTTSTPATLIPRTKVGFSSITISSRKVSRSEALLKSKPRFIARSQERVQKMARRAQERKERSRAGKDPRSSNQIGQEFVMYALNMKVILYWKKLCLFSNFLYGRPLTEVKKRKEEAKKKKEACLTNRQRVELFKKVPYM
uniref:ALMS motif domain-containing protein n=1 Tax=Hippocampus comes TaxID=109280 RepID=A0A3Q2Y7N9_HIPCM